MHLYSERQPIPKKVLYKIREDGTLDEENMEIEFGGDIIRYIQASIVMNIQTAISIRDWLTKMIEHAQKATIGKEDEKSGE